MIHSDTRRRGRISLALPLQNAERRLAADQKESSWLLEMPSTDQPAEPGFFAELSRGEVPIVVLVAGCLLLGVVPSILFVYCAFRAVCVGAVKTAASLVGAYVLHQVMACNWRSAAAVVPCALFIKLYLLPAVIVYLCARELGSAERQAILVAMGAITLRRWLVHACAPLRKNSQSGALRILLAGDSFAPKVDGVATYSSRSIEYLRARGHTVEVLCSIKGDGDHIYGAPVTRIAGVRPAVCPEHSATLPSLRIFSVLMRFRPDAVHCFDQNLFTVSMVMACWVVDIPISVSHHTRIDLYHGALKMTALPESVVTLILQFIYFFLLSSADGHLAVCPPLCKLLKGGCCGNVHLWRSGVDLKRFHPTYNNAAMRERLSGGHPELPLILHVGRIAAEKNSDQISAVVADYQRKYPDTARFAVVGDGPAREELETETDGRAIFTGFLHGQELSQAFASGDIFFSPSTTEAFPLVYLEAMASGLAVCGPDAGGVPLTFTDGVHGHLFAPLDTRATVETLRKTVDLFSTRTERVKTTRTKAEEHGWDRVVDELVTVVQNVVAARRYGSGNLEANPDAGLWGLTFWQMILLGMLITTVFESSHISDNAMTAVVHLIDSNLSIMFQTVDNMSASSFNTDNSA